MEAREARLQSFMDTVTQDRQQYLETLSAMRKLSNESSRNSSRELPKYSNNLKQLQEYL